MSGGASVDVERARLRADLALAARILAPAWPLETFIAVNPLGGLEDRPFAEATSIAAEALGARGSLEESAFRRAHTAGRVEDDDLLAALADRHPDLAAAGPVALEGREFDAVDLLLSDLLGGAPAPAPRRRLRTRAERQLPEVAAAVDAQAGKWCGAFLGAGHGAWRMPGSEFGFYPAWRRMAPRERSLPKAARERLRALPERADDGALAALASLGVGIEQRADYLRTHLACLPGWASHVRWRGERGEPINLLDYLTLRLSYEAALLPDSTARPPERCEEAGRDNAESALQRARRAAQALGASGASSAELERAADLLERLPLAARSLVWLAAYERHYRDRLLESISGVPVSEATERPLAQLVCCIDARSEGLRRHFEALGRYETFGFAGFFAVAISYRDLAAGAPSAQCPVLLKPQNEIHERPAAGAEALAERHLGGRRTLSGAEESFQAAKEEMLSPFTLAEACGFVAGPLAAAKTFAAGPYGALRERLARRAVPAAQTTLSVEEGFSADERALFAEVALRMMGLVENFGRLVVLCGHGSRTENNPYQAALDCGACGGHRGGPNARTAAAILNRAEVRDRLAERGIAVPEDTWFVAAEHDTAADTVALLDRHLVPADHLADLDRLGADLAAAGAGLSAERCAALPGCPPIESPSRAARHVRARGRDWAQVFPEWGLAGNAAFIVGPRGITRGLDLARRAFLHSYEADADPDGTALETILTAPLVVAQWINCQYYFSTVDPIVFGAGSKTIHNVLGGIGVLAGHEGDLQIGLPWQSVADGERLVHEPMRLLAIVQAPLERIETIVERNTVLQHLFDNEWVALAARETAQDPWMHCREGSWRAWLKEEVGAR